MLYQFAPAIQAGLEAGIYNQVYSNTGIPLSMVRHAAGPQAGQIAAHAIGVASNNAGIAALGLNPLTAAPQMVINAGQLYQGQITLNAVKALSASVATLQATTAVIGVGVTVTGALIAVNLWQILKLRQGAWLGVGGVQVRHSGMLGKQVIKALIDPRQSEVKQMRETGFTPAHPDALKPLLN
jgi:hypothetical protein